MVAPVFRRRRSSRVLLYCICFILISRRHCDVIVKKNKSIHVSGRVGIRAAWEWTCDECGRDNFERSIEIKATPDQIRDEFELGPRDPIPQSLFEMCSYFCYPDFVQCRFCSYVFETENSNAVM